MGLTVTVDDERRPAFAVQICTPRLLRIAIGDEPILWTRVDDDYWGYELLRPRRSQSLGVLPPIPFALVHEYSEPPSGASNRAWAKTFVEMLSTSAASPLVTGRWLLGRYGDTDGPSELPRDLVTKIVSQRLHGYVQWDFGDSVYPMTLRQLSAPDSGRVKAWRKHARAGTLPPVLLYGVTGLAACVVLDGHDRLLAASLEGTSAPALRLDAISDEAYVRDPAATNALLEGLAVQWAAAERERARPPGERLARARRLLDVERVNHLLLDAFVPELRERPTQARRIPGGIDQWVREVGSELAAQGIRDTDLLEGLETRKQKTLGG
jgi:hypothetical protein